VPFRPVSGATRDARPAAPGPGDSGRQGAGQQATPDSAPAIPSSAPGLVSRAAPLLPYFAALGAILCWASLAAALTRSLGALRPQQILAYGMGVAGVALLAWDWARGRPPWRTWPDGPGVLLGLYGIFGYHALLVAAFALAPPVQANILNYTWPLWIIVLGAWAAGQRVAGRVAVGGALGLAGAVLSLEPWTAGRAPLPAAAWLGLGLALAAGLCWGSFTVLLRRAGAATAHAMGWWCLLAACAAAGWMLLGGVPFALAPGDLPAILYIGLVPRGVAFPLWQLATRRCALPVLGLLSYLTPPLSTLLLGWAADRPATGWAWVGLAIVLGGAVLGGATLGGSARAAGRRPG